MSDARNLGETALRRLNFKCVVNPLRRSCVSDARNLAKLRYAVCVVMGCNPLRRSCVSDARNLGETALRGVRGQPSAEIVRVECVKCTLCHWGIGMH